MLLRHNMAILTNYQAVLTRKFGFYLTSAIGIVRLLIIGSRVQIRQGLLLILNSNEFYLTHYFRKNWLQNNKDKEQGTTAKDKFYNVLQY